VLNAFGISCKSKFTLGIGSDHGGVDGNWLFAMISRLSPISVAILSIRTPNEGMTFGRLSKECLCFNAEVSIAVG